MENVRDAQDSQGPIGMDINQETTLLNENEQNRSFRNDLTEVTHVS